MGGLGWSEILIILVIALIIFGPRKLPELGKSLGNSLAQFRRASEDFKRTWEDEVETEKRRIESYTPDVNTAIEGASVPYNSDSATDTDSTTSASESTPSDQYDYGYLAGETGETASADEPSANSDESGISNSVPAESEVATSSETGDRQNQQA